MKKIYKFFLFGFLTLLFTSCADEILRESTIPEENTTTAAEGCINLFVEDADLRTRDVSFAGGASLSINSVWLGVFDLEDGTLVESDTPGIGYRGITSGRLEPNVISHSLVAPKKTGRDGYFMVAIINYTNVEGRWANNPTELYDLEEMLNEVDSWEKFNSIGIDTKSAYDGNHSGETPLLAGFLNSSAYNAESPSSNHIKIDQFKSGGVNLMPEILADKKTKLKDNLRITYSAANGYSTAGHTLYLRRLVANINVNIETSDEVAVAGISYKKFNVPSTVYIIERNLLGTDNTRGDYNEFPSEAKYSPNFADLNPSLGYNSDTDWNIVDNNTLSFSFQHFANKHWARFQPTDYADREAIAAYDVILGSSGQDASRNYYFKSLCNKNNNDQIDKNDFNNYASFFKLKMRLLDNIKNRCASVEYLIHEGYTSDAESHFIDPETSVTTEINNRLRDFSTARNMNYTYKIKVYNFNNLSVNVNGDGNANNLVHRSDVSGKFWNMHYAGESINTNPPKGERESDFFYKQKTNPDGSISFEFNKYLPAKGTISDPTEQLPDNKCQIFNNYIHITENPEISFRLYGYNSASREEDKVEGYNYHFLDSSFENLSGMWPPALGNKARYFQDYNALCFNYLLDNPQINNLLFETFMFRVYKEEGNEENYSITDVTETFSGIQNNEEKVFENVELEINENQWMNLVEFVRAINHWKKIGKVPTSFDLKVSDRQADVASLSPEECLRAIYICDRNGNVDPTDGCTTEINVYAAVQGNK